MLHVSAPLAFAVLAGLPVVAAATCWEAAGHEHGVSPSLLYAIASVESSLNPRALNYSHIKRTSSYDIGLMQINSRHLPRLSKRGITEAALLDPCINLRVGAEILAELFRRRGVIWDAVGAYNASCTQLKGEACTAARATYAWKVYRRLPGTAKEGPPASEKAHGSNSATRAQIAAAAAANYIMSVRVTP